eukprot:1414294-Amphidinium_carterae.2
MALHGMVRGAVPSTKVSLAVYLDDVSLVSSDHALLLRSFAAVHCFMESWKVCLNVDKTQLLLSTVARRDWPEVFAGAEVLGSAKLLGVEVGPSLSGKVIQERLKQCLIIGFQALDLSYRAWSAELETGWVGRARNGQDPL